MLKDIAAIESRYKLFVEQAVASKLVWGLQNKKGWANSHADESEDITIVPFWSERALAKASAKDDWRDYTATEIPLTEFLESWCIGMADDDILAGINWDAEMFGKEAGGLDLALDILNRLKEIQSAIKFTKFDSIDEFIADVSASLD